MDNLRYTKVILGMFYMYEVRGKESCNIKNAGLIKNKGWGGPISTCHARLQT